MRIRVYGSTDTGRVRQNNEDSFLADKDGRLLVVCDGMGGHSKGEVASAVAVETIGRLMRDEHERILASARPVGPELTPDAAKLAAVVRLAGLRVYTISAGTASHRGMGTTLVALRFSEDGTIAIANVGDSRIYRLRDGRLSQLTRDHTFLNELLEDREISAEDARTFKQKNVLSRALGNSPIVKIDIRVDAALPGDIYLLCTDGLHGVLPNDTITDILCSRKADLRELTKALIDETNLLGGPDNVTAVVAAVDDSPSSTPVSPVKLELEDGEAQLARRQRALGKVFPMPGRPLLRRTSFLVGVGALALAVLLAVVFLTGRRDGTILATTNGSLKVLVQPSLINKAKVLVDGNPTEVERIGDTLVVENLEYEQDYNVEVIIPDYKPLTHTVRHTEGGGAIDATRLTPEAELVLTFDERNLIPDRVELKVTKRGKETQTFSIKKSDFRPYEYRVPLAQGYYTFELATGKDSSFVKSSDVKIDQKVSIEVTRERTFFRVKPRGQP